FEKVFMLDQILAGLVEEVALEGESGCTLSQFFTLIENFAKKKCEQLDLKKPILFDEKYNSFLWELIKSDENLIFSKNKENLNVSSLGYEKLTSDADFVYVHAVEEVQDQVLYGNLKSEKKTLTAAHRQVLSVVAKCRSQGVSQFQLRELLGMDGKTVFRYIKKLDELGLVVKEEAYANNIITRIVFHRRFATDPSTNEETGSKQIENGVIYRIPDFKHDILEQLKKSPNSMMGMLELIKSLGLESQKQIRWARVRLTELHDQGLVERLIASDGKHKRHVVRLIEQSAKNNDDERQADTVHREEPKQSYCIHRDLPTEYVFYRDLVAAGDHGLTRQVRIIYDFVCDHCIHLSFFLKDLLNKYSMLDHVIPLSFFENGTIPSKDPALLKYLIYRTEELEGKQRQFRYFSSETWQNICSRMGKEAPSVPEPELPAFDDLVEPDRVDAIGFQIQQLFSSGKKRASGTPLKKETKRQKKSNKQEQTANKMDSQLAPSQPPTRKRTQEDIRASEEIENEPVNSKQVRTSIRDVKKFKKTSLDTTKARRCTIMLELVEKYRICELGQDIYREFIDIEAVQNTTKIARSTFDKLVAQMHKDKQLRLFVTSVQRPSGLTEIKKIILHKDLTEESESVKQYVNNFSVERSIVSSKNKVREIQKINVDALPPSATSLPRSQIKMDEIESPRKLASKYGYIRSIWQRARSFHEALFNFCSSHHTDTIDMAEFMKTLPFERILNLVIIPYDDNTLIEFLKDSSNRSIVMQHLPKEIRSIIYQAHRKLRTILVRLIHILEALELLKPAQEEKEITSCQQTKYKYIHTSYVLCRLAHVKIYARKDAPIKQTIRLNTFADLQQFWSELKVFNTSGFEKVDNDMNESHPLLNIWSPYTWTSGLWFTLEQKNVLDSYIDFQNKKVPSESDSTIRAYLMKKLNISTHRIKTYYDSIRNAFDKSTRREKKAKKKSSHISSSPAINELMKASLEKRKVNAALFKMRQTGPFVEQTFVGSRKLRRLRLVSEPYRGQDKIGKTRLRKPVAAYSRVEEDALVYAYSIMKARASTSTFYWGPIAKVLPAHTPERSRRVLSHMMKKDSKLSSTIEELKKHWLDIYEKGIACNEIQDEKPWDTQDYDLPSYLAYFVEKLQAAENAKRIAFLSEASPLPKAYADVHTWFNVFRKQDSSVKAFDSIDEIHATESLRSETFDAIDTTSFLGDEEASIACVSSLIKMILVTPESTYCAKDAFHMLKEFSESTIEKGISKLRSDGLIVGEKAKYGRVPGRNINVSEKFLNIAAGLLPYEFFKTARQYHKLLELKGSIDIQNSELNSGRMATVLDLLSQGKLIISLKDKDQFVESKKVLHYPKASAVSIRETFVYEKLDIKIQADLHTEPVARITTSEQVYIPTIEEIKATLESLALKQPIVHDLYNFITGHRKRGATRNEISSALNETYENVSDALDLLLNAKPALIRIFGLENLRYVSAEFCSHWMLKNPQNGQYMPPLMWYDASGGLTKPALEGCEDTVMSHILYTPGISFTQLHKRLQPLFSGFELHSILRTLITKQKSTVQLASDTSFGTSSQEATYYWLAPNYYLS
ncbi:hypothetical protein A0J61_05893, partial [Choanephora cucurbitarum]